jgi:amidophosphoribosyltransferase
MCGIVGVVGTPFASPETLQALMVLQHRGQDAAGILAHEINGHRFHHHKQHGLVTQAIPENVLPRLQGEIAIGHNRYATVAIKGDRSTRDLQPQFVNYPDGIGMAHNGNLPDAPALKEELGREHRRVLVSENDIEVLLNWVALGLGENSSAEPFTRLSRSVRDTMKKAKGGFAVVGIWGGHGLFAFRDPQGLRPLVLGRKAINGNESWMLASETSALMFTGYTPVRDVAPGELLFIRPGQQPQSVILQEEKKAHCFFEWIYFSSAESTINGLGVHNVRLTLGQKLAKQARTLQSEGRLDVDVVVPVPDTSRPSAISLAESLGLPYRELLIKNRYVQRSFILPSQALREQAVYQKLTPVREGLQGKKVLLVDDSIVRGTTSRRLITLLKDAGAASVVLVSTCPPITNPCYFGIDFPDKDELISARRTPEELATDLGAERVIFQHEDDLKEALSGVPLCTGCLSGVYPVDVTAAAERFRRLRAEDRSAHDANV